MRVETYVAPDGKEYTRDKDGTYMRMLTPSEAEDVMRTPNWQQTVRLRDREEP